MKKNGRTLREDIRLVIRGIKEFDNILPGQMQLVLLRSILNSSIPYIAVILSAIILDELTQGQNREKLLCYVGISVGMTCLLGAFRYYIEAKIAVGYSHLFSAHEIYLTDKAYRLPYDKLERNETRSLREQVSGSIHLSGAGMASLYWDMDVIFTNVCSSIIALLLCVNFFRKLLLWNAVNMAGIGNTVGSIVMLAALVLICSYVSCKMTGKRFDVSFEVFENGAKYNRYGEFYTMNYLPDENAALDIRIFHQEEMIIKESQQKCYAHFARGKEREMRAVNKYDGTKLLCSAFCGFMVYVFVGQKALQGVIGIGSIVMTYAAVTMLIAALSELAQIITDLRNNNEHLIRFFQYMDLPEADESNDISEKNTEIAKEIEKFDKITFSHVSFKYPESDIWVLEDINLTINAGEKLAIVGKNGSGKTTLIQLLCRLYQPTKGRILLNDKDIWSYSYSEYIQIISTVFQDFSLFAFSVAENVAVSNNYDKERVKTALAKAGLERKLGELQRGVEQTLFHDFEEDGVELSGGEAQKLAIARAIYKDAIIMILDEPTAALDPYAEHEIYKNFHKVANDKTVFFISHRLSLCRLCDNIVVLDGGKMVQYGKHDELVKQKTGKYYELWQAQAQYYN